MARSHDMDVWRLQKRHELEIFRQLVGRKDAEVDFARSKPREGLLIVKRHRDADFRSQFQKRGQNGLDHDRAGVVEAGEAKDSGEVLGIEFRFLKEQAHVFEHAARLFDDGLRAGRGGEPASEAAKERITENPACFCERAARFRQTDRKARRRLTKMTQFVERAQKEALLEFWGNWASPCYQS